MQNEIAGWVALIILGALGILLMVATKYLISYLHARVASIKDENTRALLDRLVTIAGQKVLMIEQTVIASLRKDLEAGKITKNDLPALLVEAKKQAVASVIRDSAAMGSWQGAVSLFGKSEDAEKWLGDVVESHVAKMAPSKLGSTVPSEAAPGLLDK